METNNPLLIVVDPGHGGEDFGAMWEGRMEKDDNLRLGLAVRDELLNQGVDVLMTRDTDVFIPLADRARMANEADADLFVSLHRNSYPEQTPTAHGVENYIYLTAPEETTGRAAKMVLDEVVRVGVQSDRGVNRGNYYVLRRTKMPAMLLEMGFIINDIDNQLFDQNLYAYAQAIAKGVMAYFGLIYRQPEVEPVPPIGNLPPNYSLPPVCIEPSPICTLPPIINPAPPVQPFPPIGTLPPVVPVPPIGTLPPVEPVPPIGTLPPVVPVPPIGTLPPVEPIPPIGKVPPVEPVPPIGTLPPVMPIPPIGKVPPVEPVPPIGTLPPVMPVPPIGTLPPVKPVPPIGTVPPTFPSFRTDLIIEAQRALNGYFSANLKLDGIYGPMTKRALVRALQQQINLARKASLVLDGILGPRTLALLPTLRQGDHGNLVVLLQIMLNLKGYDTGKINGVFDAMTRTAVELFQRDNYLIPDGVAGPRTIGRLLS